MKTPKTTTIDTTIFILGIIGFTISTAIQNKWILMITMACYGYLGGRITSQQK